MIYLASPYSSEDDDLMERRYRLVLEFLAKCAEEHLVIYSPIAHWHPIAKLYDLPRGEKYWRFNNREMIYLCTQLLVLNLPGWRDSVGVARDIKYAQTYHKRIDHVKP